VSALLWPTLCAVRDVGHSGTIDEIDQQVIDDESFSEQQQAVLHNDGPRSKIEYRLAWARTHLKGMGLLDNSTRGVWATTEAGRLATRADVERLQREYRARLLEQRRQRGTVDASEPDEGDDDVGDWQERLLQAHGVEMDASREKANPAESRSGRLIGALCDESLISSR
jgi:restriction system protein